ncbi:MAG: NAD(P)-dependent oxidoreductase [bacterium]
MKVGFLGTGLMGTPMLERLLNQRISVIAYNRTLEKLTALQQLGAKTVSCPDQVIQEADCLILMLTNAAAIQEVLGLNSEQSNFNNRTIIQMGTIAPSESKQLRDQIVAKGGEYLEAPVLGSIPEAKKGTLLVMVGATEKQFHQWSNLLAHFGQEPMLIGEVGTAAALKLALNQLIAALTSAFALSLAFLSQQGVDIEKFMTILRQSALYAPTFDKKLTRMLEENYANPNFPTKHLLKDVNLFLEESEKLDLNTFPLTGVQRLLEKALEMGFAEDDYSALYGALKKELSR